MEVTWEEEELDGQADETQYIVNFYCLKKDTQPHAQSYIEASSSKIPLRFIGTIFMESDNGFVRSGTGILISPNLVLTAAHNIYDTRTNYRFEGYHPFHYSVQLELKQFKRKKNFRFDYALFKLKIQENTSPFMPFEGSINIYNSPRLGIYGYTGRSVLKIEYVQDSVYNRKGIKQLKRFYQGNNPKMIGMNTIAKNVSLSQAVGVNPLNTFGKSSERPPKKSKLNEQTCYQSFSQEFVKQYRKIEAEKRVDKQPLVKIAKKNQRYYDSLTYAINYIIKKIQNNDAFSCNYAHFLMLALYGIAFNLSFYAQGSRDTYLYQLLQMVSKKLTHISKQQPQQLNENVIMNAVVDCLQYHKYTDDNEHYLKQLGLFIDQQSNKMNTFMPLYCAYFNFIANFRVVFQESVSIPAVLKQMKKIEKAIKEKYHTQSEY